MSMYKCPKCGAWMQWRYNYGQSYWICNQCGYSPEYKYTNTTAEKDSAKMDAQDMDVHNKDEEV